jgi:hypothetical protein
MPGFNSATGLASTRYRLRFDSATGLVSPATGVVSMRKAPIAPHRRFRFGAATDSDGPMDPFKEQLTDDG